MLYQEEKKLLVSKYTQNIVIVMNSARDHNREVNKATTRANNKKEIREYLLSRATYFDDQS